MKSRSFISRIISVLIIIAAVASLGSCALKGDPVTVTIYSDGEKLSVEGTEGMTVQSLLRKADVKVSSRDKVTPDLKLQWSQAGADAITIDHYAKVFVTDGAQSNEVEVYGGTVDDAIAQAGFKTTEYDSDVDKSAHVTHGMQIHLTRHTEGLNKGDDKGSYFKGGEAVKNSVVEDNGVNYYTDSEGVIDFGYCDGVNVNGEDWIVINGVATKAQSDADYALFNACRAVAGFTDSSMTKEEKLRACYDHIRTDYFEGVRREDYKGMDWPILYSNDLLVYGKGDCFSYGAAFAYMAKAIGYTECYACNSGGHVWAEVDGLVYDPEWSLHHKDEGGDYFGIDYDNNNTEVNYKRGIAPGEPWMRVKV